MENLAKAVLAVMKEVKGIEKNTTVGSGNFSYKGVSDYDAKQAYNKAMTKHGLCILPLDVDDNIKESNWMEGNRFKRNIFCSVTTKYRLLHESGESEIICGYGHGIDTADKAAGKATTYALKYALFYTFMTPTGKIDDTDTTHSNNVEAPNPNGKPPYPVKNYEKGAKSLYGGVISIADIEKKYTVSESCKSVLLALVANLERMQLELEAQGERDSAQTKEEKQAQNQDLKQEHGQ